MARCCVKCDECSDCYTFTLSELRDLLIAINYSIALFAKSFVERINLGYPSKDSCNTMTETTVKQLVTYKKAIKAYYHDVRTKSMLCLCDSEFQRLKEKVLRLVDPKRCKADQVSDIRYDYSMYDQWVTEHPECVAYEEWEKGVVNCNPSFTITVKREPNVIRTLHALVINDNEKCVLQLLAHANKALCERKVSASVKRADECKLELASLVKKHKCNISLSLYIKLLKCNISFDLISTLLGCGANLSVDKAGNPQVRIGSTVTKIDDLSKLASGMLPENE